MEETIQPAVNNRKKAIIKALILMAFIIGAILLVRFTPLKHYLSADVLGRYLNGVGMWAPLVFILIYAAGICLFVPGTLLTGVGAAIFGAYWGFVVVWTGAMLGLSLSGAPWAENLPHP